MLQSLWAAAFTGARLQTCRERVETESGYVGLSSVIHLGTMQVTGHLHLPLACGKDWEMAYPLFPPFSSVFTPVFSAGKLELKFCRAKSILPI